MSEPQGVLDPRLAREMMAGTDAAVRAQLRFDAVRVYGAWGLAWLVGYGAMGIGRDPGAAPKPWSAIVLAVSMVFAMAVTICSIVHASRGIGGRRSDIGRLLGMSWYAGFIGSFGFAVALVRHADLGSDSQAILWAVIPALTVAILYVGQGAASGDGVQAVLGGWICLVCAAAGWAGPELVCFVLGGLAGLGFLAAAGIEWRRHRLESRRAH